MLFAVADSSKVITQTHMCAAWNVVDFSAVAANQLVDRLHETNMREAERRVRTAAVKEAAAHSGTFTQRDVFQRVKGASGMDAELFGRCWESLIGVGDLAQVAGKSRWRLAP